MSYLKQTAGGEGGGGKWSELTADKSGARTRYCRDCRHITLPMPGAYDLATCARKEATVFQADHYVTGAGESRQRYCSSMRHVGAPCDEIGKLWEARNG